MAGFERQATITWEGSARDGRGEVRAGGGAFALPVALPSRVAAGLPGQSSPEELLAAAHAACYAMALAATLSHVGASVARLHISATVRAEYGDSGLVIHTAHLRVLADGLVGLEHDRFAQVARDAERRCPISNALRGNLRIEVEAIA